jgi:hypothetical protein
MPQKLMVKRYAAADATSKKEKAFGWTRSAFSHRDVRKLRKAGMLSVEGLTRQMS